jgi:hypothetical protein
MQVFNSFGNLYNHMLAKVLAKICQSHNLMEQFPTRAQFKNDIAELVTLEEVDQLDDVGMVDVAHYLDLVENIGALISNRWLINEL